MRLPSLVLFAAVMCQAAIAVAAPDFESAKAHYEVALKKFNLGKFEEAAAEFEAAYEKSGDDALLYNIAQAFRQGRNFSRALFFFRSYLSSYRRKGAEAPNRPEVEGLIAEAERYIGSQPAPPTTSVPTTTEKQTQEPQTEPKPEPPPMTVEKPTPPQPTPTPDGSRPPAWARTVGIVTLAAGVAGLGVGGAMAALAAHGKSELEQGKGEFTSSLQATEASIPTYRNAMIATFVVGGVLAAGGASLLGWSAAHHEKRVAAAPLIGGNGAGLVVSGSF